METRLSRYGTIIIALVILFTVGITVLPTLAAPAYTATVTLSQIDGLDLNPDVDFWAVDYFDTNGRGDANDPTVTLATPPTLLSGYGSTALRMSTGPGTGGSGCARLGGKPFFGTTSLAGTTLSELTQFGYSYLVASNSGPAAVNLTVYTNIFVDKNGDGVWLGGQDSILIYEPFYTVGAPILGTTWYDNLAIGTGATGRWHYAAQPLGSVGNFTPDTVVDLWSEIIAQTITPGDPLFAAVATIGDLKIVNPAPGCVGSTQGGSGFEGTGSGLVIVVGQKSGTPWNNFVGFVDGVYLTATGTNATTHVDNLNAIGDPVTAIIVSGNNQSTAVNTAFAPLVVELRDASNTLVEAGTIATITVPVAGASATFISTSVTANASGIVTFYPTANGTVGGPYLATVTSGSASVSFNLTNTATVPPTTVQVFPVDVFGLAGDNTDFWNVDYYDTNPSLDNPVGSISRTVNAATNGGYASFEFYVGEQAGTNGGNPAGCTGMGGKTWFGTTKLAGMTLRDLDQLSFSEMVKTLGIGDLSPNLLPYVNIFFDMNNDSQWLPTNDGILVFNGNLGAPYVLGQWYDTGDLAASGSTRLWNFAVRSPLPSNFGLNAPVLNYRNMMSQTVDVSVLGGTTVGDLKIVNPVSGCVGTPTSTEGTGNSFTFVFGQKNGGSYNGMVAHIDSIVLTTSGGGSFDINNFYDITDYGPATTITATSGTPQSTLISTAFASPLLVTVTDALGNTVPGESVTFTVPVAGASAVVTSPLVTGLLNGQVSTPATANATVGSYVVTANITPPLPTAASFALTNFTPGVTVTPTTVNVTEGGVTGSYTVVLTSQPTAAVTVTVTGDADVSVSPTPLTFTAVNWFTPQTVTVTAVDDLIVEGAHIGTITHATTSADGNYNALIVASVTANITDNDTAGVTVTPTTVNVTEGGVTGSYTVVLTSQPTADVTVTVNGDAQASVSPTPLTFTTLNWNLAQSMTVTAINDLIAEGAHIGTITHTTASVDGSYEALIVASVTVNITDNDTVGVTITQSGGTTNVSEAGATDTYTVVLNTLPANSVNVNLSFGSQIVASPVSLTFTTGNWNVAQTITVQAVDDLTIEGAHIDTVTHATASADVSYNALIVASVTVNITDNDVASVTELLINGSFNADSASPKRVPTGWIGRSLSGDGQKCGNPAKSFDGVCYLVFKGNLNERGRMIQEVPVTGLVAGQTLTLTASGNAKGGAKGLIEMLVFYDPSPRLDSNTAKSQLRWETNTPNYTTQTILHTFVDTPIGIKVRIRSRAATGTWFVDGVSMTVTSSSVLRLPGE